MSLGFSELPSRASDDLKAAITNIRAPLLNELDAESIEAIKTRLIEIGTILGLSDGSTANSIAKALGAALATGTYSLMRSAGGNTQLRHNLGTAPAPTSGDDSDDGYGVGSVWIQTTGQIWICGLASVGAAVWYNIPSLNFGGLQAFSGIVNFENDPPTCSSAPTQDEDLANKLFVENAIASMFATLIGFGDAVADLGSLTVQGAASFLSEVTVIDPPTEVDHATNKAYVDAGRTDVEIESSATHTLTDADSGKTFRCTHASGCAVSVAASGITPGTSVRFVQWDTDSPVSVGGAATLRHPATFDPETAEQYSTLVITILDNNEVLIEGDLAAA